MAFRRLLPALRSHSTAFSTKVVCRRLGPISSVKQQCLPVLRCYNRPFSSEAFLESRHQFLYLPMPRNKFDVVINDIDELELEAIGKIHHVENLGPGSFTTPSFPATGHILGPNNRFMIPLVCQVVGSPKEPVNVWFLVDTRATVTYLTMKTMHAIFGPEADTMGDLRFLIHIQDQRSVIDCEVSKRHFKEVNILGAYALRKLKLSMRMDWDQDMFQLYQDQANQKDESPIRKA
uniref:Uncharacterized protein n=1 Tax=Panagrolaimus sp. JU765 TaxID=591449 RepID=A0AC34QI88_9BILA